MGTNLLQYSIVHMLCRRKETSQYLALPVKFSAPLHRAGIVLRNQDCYTKIMNKGGSNEVQAEISLALETKSMHLRKTHPEEISAHSEQLPADCTTRNLGNNI